MRVWDASISLWLWTEPSVSHKLLTGGFSKLLVTWTFPQSISQQGSCNLCASKAYIFHLIWSSVIYLFAITWKCSHSRNRPLPPSLRAAKRKPTRNHRPQKHEASCCQLSSQTLSQGHRSLCVLFFKVKRLKQTQGWQYLVTPQKSNLKLYWSIN